MSERLCVCGHPQGRHLLARRDCKSCRDCTAFEAAAVVALDVTALLAEVEGDASREADLAARLADVERQLAEARRQRDANMTASADAARKLIAERDGAAERWANAREEIERLTAQLGQAEDRCRQIQDEDLPEAIATATKELQAELDLARLTVGDLRQHEITRARLLQERGAEVTSLRDRLKQAEEYARDLQDQLPAGERLYDTHVRYLCPVCGGRYREFHTTHPCARLVPVRVRITFIEE
ncbi:hypothetical protein Aph02nite_17170 [Actinoplanes philippinensis]|uniref:Uncharacterized protein n=1 Tax=Actinoplanes philippinensis TaxID=35752 RepID=A0A1I2B907_9ACTN|nr:hypothetical protein [Actinoplanes philippinensis]GIE75767.1 hypothetical protein Aph02nite_17170 [Actinoplanes philippinensis]SFE52644.1 hypothetical protein SAMN05421541_102181 [Actinoplanes philippinensis]